MAKKGCRIPAIGGRGNGIEPPSRGYPALSLERRTGTENQFPPPNGAKARFGDKVAAVPR